MRKLSYLQSHQYKFCDVSLWSGRDKPVLISICYIENTLNISHLNGLDGVIIV